MSCTARLPIYILLISAFFSSYAALVLSLTLVSCHNHSHDHHHDHDHHHSSTALAGEQGHKDGEIVITEEQAKENGIEMMENPI